MVRWLTSISRLALLAGAVLSQQAAAQRLTGVVRDTATDSPLVGAVVTTLDRARTVQSQSITDEAGRYSLPLGANVSDVRVVRIGFQPRMLPLPGERGASLVLDFSMRRLATLLSGVAVNYQKICSEDVDRTKALSLWEQARAALLASVVAREALPATAMLMAYERSTDSARLVLHQAAQIHTGSTKRPFSAPDAPRRLAEDGYLDETGNGRVFKAPDADVLLDDSFAETHCFTLRGPDAAHGGLLGLAFQPAKGRDRIVDVRGTLWIDPRAPELEALEYGYTGRGDEWEIGGTSGSVFFHTMSNGVAFVSSWRVKVPVLRVPPSTLRNSRIFRQLRQDTLYHETMESGGVVLSATWPSELHYQSSVGSMEGVVLEEETSRRVARALVVVLATGDTLVTNDSGRFSLYPVLPGRYQLRVIDSSNRNFLAPRVTTIIAEVRDSLPTSVQASLPPMRTALASLCGGSLARGEAVILGRLVDTRVGRKPPGDTRIEALWLGDSREGSRVLQQVSLDGEERFSICGVRPGTTVHLSIRRPGVTFADTTLTASADSLVATLAWSVNIGTLASATPPKPATFRGRVAREDGGAPVAGADVWIPAVDRHARTDSTGTFAFDDLPARELFVQVRKLGFAVQRDTLTTAGGVTVTRGYALASQARVLDTIRTVAAANKWISPGLREFEERRVNSATGYFIADSVLRHEEGKALASIALSRLSGVTLVPGPPAGAVYLVSSRKRCRGTVLSDCSAPNCFVSIYLDGARFYSAATDSPPVDASRLQVDEFAGVEFYQSGAAPPQYNSTDAGCGTLLLWSRER